MAQIRNQRKQDLLITTTFEKQMKRDKKDGVVSDMLATRAQEIKKELESAVIQALNDSRLVISELDNIEVEPNSNICPNFPKEIFNYTDRLTLLNEGLALYAEPDLDKDNLEYKLSRIISDTMSKLPNVKKDILSLRMERSTMNCSANIPDSAGYPDRRLSHTVLFMMTDWLAEPR